MNRFQDFIRAHENDDVRRLALDARKYPEVDVPWAIAQIEGHRRAKTKIPSWAACEPLVYPPHLNMEQCSSEQTARYKASLVEGQAMADLTGGFGVDCYFLGQRFQRVTYVECNSALCDIVRHNYRQLGFDRAAVVCRDGMDYLHQMEPVDLIFIDPARRDAHGARTYGIGDCTPNILEHLDTLLLKARRVMVKLSPMLDWHKAVDDLRGVSEVHIVSVGNECRELLLLLERGYEGEPMLVCANDDGRFVVRQWLSPAEPAIDCTSANYLYEPNASIMKAGCFAEVARNYGVAPVGRNSHLFVSEQEVKDFPGRRFQISAVSSMNKRDLKRSLAGVEQANIAVRNFPMTADDLRRRLKLRDGGSLYIFATTVSDGAHCLYFCRKIG